MGFHQAESRTTSQDIPNEWNIANSNQSCVIAFIPLIFPNDNENKGDR